MAQHRWAFGPRAGVSFAKLTNDHISGYKPGLLAGAFGEYRIQNFAAELAVLFSQQGERQLNSILDLHSKNTNRTDNYIILPLRAKYYTPFAKGLNIFAGPQFDLGFGFEQYIGPSVDTRTGSISLTMGVGYRFDFGLDLTANYNLGLQDRVGALPSHNSRNSVFQVAVGYAFTTK